MFKLIKKFTKTEWILTLVACGFVFADVWLTLTMPDYMSQITMLIQTQGSAMGDILLAGGKMLLCALGSLVAAVGTSVCAAKVAANFSANIRGRVYDKVQSFSLTEIGHFSTSSLITRSINDITQVQTLIVMGLAVLIKAPVTAVWAICKIATKNSMWMLCTLAAVAALMIIVGTCIAFALPRFKSLQKLTDNINRITRENLTGLPVVRAYNAENYQEKKFDEANEKYTKTQLFTNRMMGVLYPGITMIMSGLSLAIYWVGAVLIQNAGAAEKMGLFSDMVVFSQYAAQVVMAFMMLVMIFILLPRATVSAKRINEVLETPLELKDGVATAGKSGMVGEIEFKNVSFRYPDAEEDVLSAISFTAHCGETVAFIGSTGCGKSTVIHMVPRFYDVSEGQVLVDGIDVKEYSLEALHNKIGYVSQKATLFSGTVESNVAFGDNGNGEFPKEDILSAIDTAQASEFVEKLEGGLDGYISQGGSNLSGGQKQRMSIARAICRNPEILIFDDSFSALDYKTDRKVREALNQKCKNVTKLIVGQRIGTIRDADKIIVLDDGKIAGMGTHNQLMESCEVYQQIALSQLSKEELE